MHTSQIEQQLTILLRRVQRIHVTTSSGDVVLDRSAYGIMCRLADHGAHRLGSLAQVFGLDPSTITRQVQSLEAAALVERHTDPTDRRAALLDLTPDGARLLHATREWRRERLQQALADWSEEDHDEFARLLEKFNTSLDGVVQHHHGSSDEPS